MGRIREQSLGVAALLLAVMCAACANDAAQMEQSTPDAVYVLPTEIPSGWTVGVATQRIELGELPDGEVVEFGDYTVSWVLEENAGRDRDNVNDNGPVSWINVGSRYYEDFYWPAILGETASTPPIGAYGESTPLTREGDSVELTFRVECCLVQLGANGVDDSVVRRIAKSMTALDLDEWQSELGDRLLVDDQR
jgi:hypothetical protein